MILHLLQKTLAHILNNKLKLHNLFISMLQNLNIGDLVISFYMFKQYLIIMENIIKKPLSDKFY